jgi:DNA-binding LacI/PurR family transcriptional regulator
MPSHPTIIDVASEAGVSKSTVSRVLRGDGSSVREETRAKVWAAVKRLGYEHNAVASSLRTNRTYTVMLAIPDITNPFWPEVARGLQDAVEEHGYAVVLSNSDWDVERERRFLRLAGRNRFDAIAINPTGVSNTELLATRIPTVILGVRGDCPDFDMVGSDSYGGTIQALNHLYSLGHRRIAMIRGQHRGERGRARLAAYDEFLSAHDLAHDPSLLVATSFDLQGGAMAMQMLLALASPPTAVLAANDILAIGAMQAAHQMGLNIPADLSIVGMDDIYPAATTNPPLTTLAKAKYEIGRQAARFLLDRIEGKAPDVPRRQVIACRLIERNSTAPPKPAA